MKVIDIKTNLLLGFYVGALLLANILGTKITTILGVRVSVGIFFVPLLFLITDIIAEVKGKKEAMSFVFTSIIVLIFTLIMTWVSVKMPANPTWGMQEQYAMIFSGSARMMVASMIAFIISQYHDVWTFNLLKKRMHGKYLWLRNNVSTMISQAIDTTLFMFIAFYQVTPKFTAWFIVTLIIPYWLFKVAFALIDTPFVYAGVWWLKRE